VRLEARFSLEVGEGPRRFSLEVDFASPRGVLVLFGPSGVGKSLTLLALAGLLSPRAGRIALGDETLFDAERRVDVPAHRRRIGYVPQQSSLFPFRRVIDNVAFGLDRARRKDARRLLAPLLDELGISALAEAAPEALSGGERQRVALARALAVEPRLLLLDEPFASIDRGGRRALREVLARTLEARGIPAVLVTHDPAEARRLGTEVVLYARGRTLERVAPEQLLLPGERRLRARAVEVREGLTTLAEARVEGTLDTAPGADLDLAVEPED